MPPIVIAGGIAAAGAVGSAAIGAHAAGSAADTQAASADKALALQERMYGQTRADLQPWAKTGAQAVGTLGALMGMGGSVNGQALPQPAPYQPPQTTPQAQPQGGLAGIARTVVGWSHPELNSQSSAGQMVTLRAPDGSTRQFQQSDPNVQKFLSAGAQLVQ